MDNRFFLIAAFFAIIYPLQHAKAQDSNDSLAFVSANWNWQEIGNGAKAGYAQFRIFGSTQSISIVKYPARKFRTQIINSPGNIANTTDSLAMKYASLVAINGSFFNTKTLYPHTFLSINHKIEGISSAHEYRRSNGILAFKDRKGRKRDRKEDLQGYCTPPYSDMHREFIQKRLFKLSYILHGQGNWKAS